MTDKLLSAAKLIPWLKGNGYFNLSTELLEAIDSGELDAQQWISDKNLYLNVFYQRGDEPFVSGVNGICTITCIEDIEKEITNNLQDYEEGDFSKGDGDYIYKAFFNSKQTGQYGATEIPEYWELELVSFRPIDPLKAESDE